MNIKIDGALGRKLEHKKRLETAKPDSIAIKRPDLMGEWDWNKNEALGLDPYQLTCGSNKKVWWTCPNHPDGFDMSIGHRCRPNARCPYCSGKRIVVGENDLASQFPDIAAEWDYEKNGDLKPSAVFKCSDKSVWWICEEHGSYKQPVSRRTAQGSGCKKCGRERTRLSRIRPKPGESLADVYPDLASEWNWELNETLTPADVRPHSQRKVWWLGKCGHKWDAIIDSRASGRGCPYCAGKKLLTGFNDLATVDPGIAKEWHPIKNGDLKPTDVLAGSHDKVWWLGECGHSWYAQIKNRVAAHTGCSECYKSRQVSFSEKAVFFYVSKVFEDAEQNAHVDDDAFGRLELDIWIPSISTAIEYDGYYWHNLNHERDARKDKACRENGIRLIRIRENLCDDYDGCSAEIIKLDSANETTSLARGIVALMHDLVGAGAFDFDIDIDDDRVAIMSLVKSDFVDRSLAETHPEVAAQWHPDLNGDLTPMMFTRGSKYKAWWICPAGHDPYQTSICTRTRGCGCPACKADSIRADKLKPKPGHSLAERFPDIAREWHPTKNGNLTPENVSYGSRTYMIWWICPNGHDDYQMLPNGRTSGHGCPECARESVSIAAYRRWAIKRLPVGTQLQLDIPA